jgi:RNA polymerase sigma-70 factor (ECF subfamily)
MADDPSFDDVMTRLGGGDPAAAAAIFDRFAHRLIALARARLDARLRQKVDPDDVLQSVCRTFFRRCRGGEFSLGGWDGLWALLTVITVRKCADLAAHFRAKGCDIAREAVLPAAEEDSGVGWTLLAREPTPEEAAMLAETVEGLLRGLEGRDREIVALALEGHTAPEISRQLNRPRRTVYRVLENAKKRLRRLRDPG